MSLLGKIKNVFSNGDASLFDSMIETVKRDLIAKNAYFWGVKVNEQDAYVTKVATWPDKKKVDFLVWCIEEIGRNAIQRTSYSSQDNWYQRNGVCDAFMGQFLRTKLEIDDEDLERIIHAFVTNKKWDHGTMIHWPISSLINQLDRQYKGKKMTGRMITALTGLNQAIRDSKAPHHMQKELLKLTDKIEALIFKQQNEGGIKVTLFKGEDRFSAFANPLIESLPLEEREFWYQLIEKAQKATGSKPSQKYLNETKDLFKQLGADSFKKMVNNWFDFLNNLKENVTEHTYTHGTRTYTYTTSEYISSINAEAMKGFVWMCSNFHDNATLNNVARLAERSYKKIPGKGPTAASLGNACLFQLYSSKGLDGIGHLSRLKLRIKQSSTQSAIEKYIREAAEKEGVSTHEIEDMAVEDFGLVAGEKEYLFEDYKCLLKITGIGKSELFWFKPDGKPQKGVPAFVKEKFSAKLKKIKDTQKQLDLTTSAQRDRIDRMFRSDRKISLANFNKFYIDHGLMCFISNNIIWTFIKDQKVDSAFRLDNKWITGDQAEINPLEYEQVTLWHPARHKTDEVKKWREFQLANEIRQPLKQAYREVYILTDAEVNTKSYSNRMAAHVLKQHQFNSLAKTRGWKYSLMGAYDDGRYNEAASVMLPEYGLRAEYWINELNADNEFNDTGIWNYITTDQVRFVNTTSDNPIDLIEVPPVLFSEILRDVDLFVGVASVGNDAAWRDSGGIPAYRDYWTSYSFGDLSEVAKNRKEILSGLIPRLKINKVSEIRDKFLVVKGKLRTYKIHIGSTNILMDPNDQYLCIVPDRSKKNPAENLFIPFEGDSGLSVILSKAFLLADDDKITDTTITSQINRK